MRIIIETDDEKNVNVTKVEENIQKEWKQNEVNLEDLTEEEAERFEIASDLANVCEYLEENEVIQLKLLVAKCKARKERS